MSKFSFTSYFSLIMSLIIETVLKLKTLTALCLFKVGPRMVYCGTLALFRNHLPRFGVECTLVDGFDVSSYRKAVKPNTKVWI